MCPDQQVPAPPTSGEQPATGEARVVLAEADIARALKRIAHEIVEANKGAEHLMLLGIPTRGVALAKRLAALIAEIEVMPSVPSGAIDITLYRDDLRRQPTRAPHPTDIPGGGVDGKVVVLVDDVLYSGRSVRAALDALADYGRPAAVRLAVLVDRGHRQLPIRADHVGKNLPTASTEQVRVCLKETDGQADGVLLGGGGR